MEGHSNGRSALRAPSLEVKPSKPSEISDAFIKIRILQHQILMSRRNWNGISILLDYVRCENEESDDSILAAVALGRVFIQLLATGKMSLRVGASESDIMVTQWITKHYEDYKTELLRIIKSSDVDKSLIAFTLIIQLIREDILQRNLLDDNSWRDSLFQRLLGHIVSTMSMENVRMKFIDEYLTKYDDIRYFAFSVLGDLSSSELSKMPFNTLTSMMARVDKVPESPGDIQAFLIPRPENKKDPLLSPRNHKKVAQTFWISVLRLDLDISQREAILELIPHQIAPWFLKVELLMDFLTDSFDAGGGTSLSALSGLFYLIREKSLSYPQFYTKLYSLLTPSTMHSKRRSRFFRLLDTFLASTHLPAGLVASFIKRLSRLALYAAPSGIVVVVPWIYNLLRNHPTCTFMLHRNLRQEEGDGAQIMKEEGYHDSFCMEEPDPMKTGALDSSLWELQMLQSHYHPNVATIARIISEQFRKPSFNLEHFLNHSYGSMLDAELSRPLKRPPQVEYEIPKKIFLRQAADSAEPDALVTKLWDFS